MAILERHDSGAIAHLRLNAPERLNALSDEMLEALQEALDRLATERQIRVVLLSGEGRAFCAGHDLKEMQQARQAPDKGAATFEDLFRRCARVMTTIGTLPQPVIALPHGIATAAGCQLVAACDLAVAAEGTRFGVNGVNIGLFCSTPMVALSRNLPRKQAFEMLTTGAMIDSDRALELGLINRAVPAEEQMSEAMALASTIAEKLDTAIRIGKQAFYRQLEMPLDAAYDFTAEVMVRNMLDSDTDEGIQAFLEKRKPGWKSG